MEATERFHALVSGIDYPMFVVTAAAGPTAHERDGCLVGFATQASIDPPRLLVMISKANRTYRMACGAAELVVHFLHEENRDLAVLFGELTGDDVDKFAACRWHETAVGTPVLSGTRGWVRGTILDRVDAGDHVGHLLSVDEAAVDTSGAPLSFQSVRDMEPGHPA
jgi:flavin reductase (DIM6/NTAB) family NADH-FMN oxidoreductase RutF